MERVQMHITGKAVGASGQEDAFAEMVRVTVGHIAPHAHPQVRVGADDAVRIELVLERRLQIPVGEALEQLLTEADISSSVVDEPAASGSES
jgi:hypothetical protein